MHNLVKWAQHNWKTLHPIELAALLHHKLVFINPFLDGNGRTARLVMNIVLMQYGYPLVIILKHDQKKYYDVLEKADKGEYRPLALLFAQAVERSIDIYLKTLMLSQSASSVWMPLSQVAEHTPYSKKYLNLLARYGRIEVHKDGHNWLSSIDAIRKYQANRQRKRKQPHTNSIFWLNERKIQI